MQTLNLIDWKANTLDEKIVGGWWIPNDNISLPQATYKDTVVYQKAIAKQKPVIQKQVKDWTVNTDTIVPTWKQIWYSEDWQVIYNNWVWTWFINNKWDVINYTGKVLPSVKIDTIVKNSDWVESLRQKFNDNPKDFVKFIEAIRPQVNIQAPIDYSKMQSIAQPNYNWPWQSITANALQWVGRQNTR